MKNIQNQWIWITGASSGIGRALAIEFSKKNCHLVLLSRNMNELEITKGQCSKNENQNILLQKLDLSDPISIKNAFTSLKIQKINCDILINCGGISQRSLALETKDEVERKLFEINYFGTIALTKLVVAEMALGKKGHLVIITSLVGIIGSPKRTAYSASKHALHGYFDSLRAELNHENIKVTIICPGFINTNISYAALTANGEAQNTMDDKTKNGMHPNILAQKTIKAILKEKEEFYIGGKEILAIYLKRFVPTIFSKILKNAKVT